MGVQGATATAGSIARGVGTAIGFVVGFGVGVLASYAIENIYHETGLR